MEKEYSRNARTTELSHAKNESRHCLYNFHENQFKMGHKSKTNTKLKLIKYHRKHW